MEQIEYMCVMISGGGKRTTQVLNQYGREGWELVATCFVWHYFKRPLRDNSADQVRSRTI